MTTWPSQPGCVFLPSSTTTDLVSSDSPCFSEERLMVFSGQFCLIGLVTQNFLHISNGLGLPFAEVPKQNQKHFLMVSSCGQEWGLSRRWRQGCVLICLQDLYFGLVLYQTCLLFTKLTLFFQFYRILRQTHMDNLKVLYLGVMFIIAAWQVAQIFVEIFSCFPIQGVWDSTIHRTCHSVDFVRIMNTTGNIATDCIILLLPLPVLWRLTLPLHQKIAVFGVFGLGFL